MQEEEYINCRFGEIQPQYKLFDELFPQEDCKGEGIVLPSSTLPSVDDSIPKKKGRPKGQRNSTLLQKRIKSEAGEGKQKGHWLLTQNKRYHLFLEVHHRHFICREMRRLDKIFKTMATFVGTRQAEQCRSHHQKMQKKFTSFARILLYLRKQHFGSEQVHPIEEELRQEYEDMPKILDSTQLHYLEEGEEKKKQKQQERKQLCSPVQTSLEEHNSPVSFENILDDDYEHQFGLEFLL